MTNNFNLPHGIACSFTLPSLLIYNSQKDDGRFKQLIEDLQFKSIVELSNYLNNLLKELEIPKILKKFLPENHSEVLILSKSMLNPERSKNNIRDADYSDIEDLLAQTFKILNY